MSMIIKCLATVFVYVWSGVEIYLHVKQRKQNRAQASHDMGSLKLIFGAIAVGYSIGIPFAFSPYGQIEWGKPYLSILGLLIIVAGVFIRFTAIKTLNKYFTYTVKIQEQHELIEKGLYRYVRHPAYLGELLIFFGTGLAFANWISLVSLFGCPFVAFSVRINVEEKVLSEHFAARYEEYRKRTWRLIPWLY
jgi:protein-S-isoprenylcysteine O-methyltransferase Ste14